MRHTVMLVCFFFLSAFFFSFFFFLLLLLVVVHSTFICQSWVNANVVEGWRKLKRENKSLLWQNVNIFYKVFWVNVALKGFIRLVQALPWHPFFPLLTSRETRKINYKMRVTLFTSRGERDKFQKIRWQNELHFVVIFGINCPKEDYSSIDVCATRGFWLNKKNC